MTASRLLPYVRQRLGKQYCIVNTLVHLVSYCCNVGCIHNEPAAMLFVKSMPQTQMRTCIGSRRVTAGDPHLANAAVYTPVDNTRVCRRERVTVTQVASNNKAAGVRQWFKTQDSHTQSRTQPILSRSVTYRADVGSPKLLHHTYTLPTAMACGIRAAESSTAAIADDILTCPCSC